MEIRKIQNYGYSLLQGNKLPSIDKDMLKKRIMKAISAGNHETRYIIEACKAELHYYLFCQAISELISSECIEHKEVGGDNGYYLK